MSRKELHSYVLDHREDQEAFYIYVDKLHAEANWVEMPAVESLEDLEKYPEFTRHFQRGSGVKNNA
nr:hypothetical protein [Synechococcus sp. PCC 7502]